MYKLIGVLILSLFLFGCNSRPATSDGKLIAVNIYSEICINGVTYYTGFRSMAPAYYPSGKLILCGD